MKKQSRRIFVFSATSVAWLGLLFIWIYIWMTNYTDIISRPFGYKGNWLVFALYGGLLFLFTHVYGGYKVGYYKQTDVLFSSIIALIFTNTLTYIQICLLGARVMPIKPILFATFLGTIFLLIWAISVHYFYQKKYPPYTLLMIYDGKPFANHLIEKIMKREDKYVISETIDSSTENLDYIYSRMKEYKSIVLSDLDSKTRNTILKYSYENGIRVYMTPKLSDIIIRNARTIELFDSPILLTEMHELSVMQKIGKRAIDIFVSIVGIIITFPIMLVIGILIKRFDNGPILYKQIRLTKDGKTFLMYKLRSMVVDADKSDGNRLATENDDRITPIGKIIRKIRVDELPQLINILKGEMSVVGPRPEHPEIAAEYLKDIPEFSYRLKMKAGLTGYAQVVGKYSTTPLDKIKMDLMYITSYSLLFDIKIILMTFKVIFNFDSTKGIKEGKKNAKIDKKGKKS